MNQSDIKEKMIPVTAEHEGDMGRELFCDSS